MACEWPCGGSSVNDFVLQWCMRVVRVRAAAKAGGGPPAQPAHFAMRTRATVCGAASRASARTQGLPTVGEPCPIAVPCPRGRRSCGGPHPHATVASSLESRSALSPAVPLAPVRVDRVALSAAKSAVDTGFGALAIAKPPQPQVHFPTIEARDAHYAAKIQETVRTLEDRHTSVEAFNAQRDSIKDGNYCVDGMCDVATVGCCLTCAP